MHKTDRWVYIYFKLFIFANSMLEKAKKTDGWETFYIYH